jgi:peptide/nickel transport system substrate-binding protein
VISTQLTTERLFQTTPGGEHQLRLAEYWQVTDHPDGRQTFAIALRRGVTFHDGTPLTAGVVKNALDAARNDVLKLQENPALADIERIDVAAPDRLELKLRRASALIFDALTIQIQLEKDGRLIGTGPFSIDEEANGKTRLVANPEYHRGRPSIDVVALNSYPTLRAAWTAMMREEIDFLFEVPSSAREFFEAASNVGIYTTPSRYALTMAFNMRNAKLFDPILRRALNHAVDRRTLIEQSLAGDGRPASGVWSAHWAYGGIERTYRYDPTLANDMMTQAGFPPVDELSAESPDDPLSRFQLTCLVPVDTAPLERIALLVQRQLREVGVEMKLEAINAGDLGPRVARGDWDAILLPLNTGRNLSRLYEIWHSSEALTGYTSADGILENLRHAATRAELATATATFRDLIYEDPPAIFLAQEFQARAISGNLEVPPLEAGQDVIQTLWQWQRTSD